VCARARPTAVLERRFAHTRPSARIFPSGITLGESANASLDSLTGDDPTFHRTFSPPATVGFLAYRFVSPRCYMRRPQASPGHANRQRLRAFPPPREWSRRRGLPGCWPLTVNVRSRIRAVLLRRGLTGHALPSLRLSRSYIGGASDPKLRTGLDRAAAAWPVASRCLKGCRGNWGDGIRLD